MDVSIIRDAIQNEGFTINYKPKNYKYFFEDMQKKLSFAYSEFGLAIKILMTKQKGLSDFFIIANYKAIQVWVEINKVQQVYSYKKFREYLLEALTFRADFLYDNEENKKKEIERKIAVYDLFLETSNNNMNYFFDDLDESFIKKFKQVYSEQIKGLSESDINVLAREKMIQFWTQINRGLITLYDGKEVGVPQSLGFSMNIQGELEKRDYRIQADPVSNFYGIKNWTYRLLATSVVPLEKLGYDEYIPLIKDKIWSQKLHIWCGTTNSGKSTSIISALSYMYETKDNEGEKIKIYTIEDPIEKKLDFAYQMQADYTNPNPNERKTFTDGVKSAMRNSPRVIVVGEIRDLDTGIEALNSAISGHIVISTIHTNTSFAVFQRLKNLKSNSGDGEGISLNDILSGLGLISTTNLLTTYPINKTILLKQLLSKVDDGNGGKTYFYLKNISKGKDKITGKYYSDSPILDDIFFCLIEFYKKKQKIKDGEELILEGNYPLLRKIYNDFAKFKDFYYNNIFIDYGDKIKVFDTFEKWFEYTINNHRIVVKKVDNTETSMKPVMEILDLTPEHINLLQTASGETEIYNWLNENEKTFLPRFYFAFIKNQKLQQEKEMTFDFRDITTLVNIAYVFRV